MKSLKKHLWDKKRKLKHCENFCFVIFIVEANVKINTRESVKMDIVVGTYDNVILGYRLVKIGSVSPYNLLPHPYLNSVKNVTEKM